MKSKLFILMALAGASAFAQTRISIGVNIGGGYPGYYPGYYPGGYYMAVPPPPPPVYYAPPSPGRGYVWVGGYYYPAGRSYQWRQGYWTRPPRGNVRWVAPRYRQGRYYSGYWR